MLRNNMLRCFLTLAETGSFTLTARTLFLSQQAVSKNISNLENELGLTLFLRTSRSVELTPEGQQCYELFSKLENQYSVGIAAIRRDAQRTAQTLQIGLQSFLDFSAVIEPALALLREAYPELKAEVIRFSPLMLQERLRDGQLHLILVYQRFLLQTKNIKMIRLTSSPRCLMVSPKHELVREGGEWAQLRRLPLIVDSVRGEGEEDFQKRVQEDIRMLGLEPSEIIWVPDRDTAYTYAEIGRGAVVGTEMSRMARDRSLARYPLEANEVLLAVWSSAERNPLVERCAQTLRRVYQDQRPEGR